MTGTIARAAAIYLVLTFPLGYLWHLTLFRERYAALRIYRERVVPPLGLAAMVVQGLLFGAIYAAMIAPLDTGWFGKGFAYAAFAGLLSWSFGTLAAAAKNPMTSIPGFIAIETAFTIVQWIPVGLATALLA